MQLAQVFSKLSDKAKALCGGLTSGGLSYAACIPAAYAGFALRHGQTEIGIVFAALSAVSVIAGSMLCGKMENWALDTMRSVDLLCKTQNSRSVGSLAGIAVSTAYALHLFR